MKTKQLFCAFMLSCLLPLASWADIYTDPATGVNYYYEVGIASASVTNSPSVSGDIEILSHFRVGGATYKVVIIDKEAFYGCSNLTNVTIPNSVTSIGIEAFYRSGLTSVTIPNSVRSIDQHAFALCTSLINVTIPNSVANIGAGAFGECHGLTSITIPNSVTNIDTDAFRGCWGLTEIYSCIEEPFSVDCWREVDFNNILLYVPKGTKAIYEATYGWHEFTNIIEMEDGETPTGNIKFADAEVKRICVENWDTNGDGELSYDEAAAVKDLGRVFKGDIKSFNEFQYFTGVEIINQFAFEFCQNLSSIKFPNSIQEIYPEAFVCTGLTSISIPKSVTRIGVVAFEACEKLASITVEEGNKVYDSRNNCNAIINTRYNDLIVGCKNTVIPASVTGISQSAFEGSTGLTSIEIPSKVKYIGPGAFIHSGLTSITIPKSVSNIGEVAFADCFNLSTIIVEEGNTTFDSRDNCNAIINTKTNELISGCKATIIPNTVTAIGKRAFEGHETLTEIIIPNSVTSIAENAFYRTCIESLHIPSSVTTIGSQAFGGCYKLKTITFEKWPENVGSKIVFYGSNALEKVIVFDREPTAIGDDTFLNSYNGTWTAATLYVPAGTKALYEATDGWKNFKNIVEMEGETPTGNIEFANAEVKRICVENWDTNGDGELSYEEASAVTDLGKVFTGNHNILSFDELKYFTGLTVINERAFYACRELISVTLPNSLISISEYAFFDCYNITNINLGNSVTHIGRYAIGFCDNLTSITIPNSVTTIDEYAFDGCIKLSKITIPNSVTSIGRYTFMNCKALTEIYSYIENPFRVDCWGDVDLKKIQLYVPKGTKAKYQATVGWNEFTNIIEMGDGDTPTVNIMFADAEVKRICVENWDTNDDGELGYDEAAAVKDLGEVFRGNNKIKTFDEFQYFTGIETINRQTFEYCKNLSSIIFPNSIKYILLQAFVCTSLTSISIPKSVTGIEPDAFEACEKLAYITVEEGNKVYDSRDNCNAIIDTEYNSLIVGCKNTIIPASVTAISQGAFNGSTGLTSIEIPSRVKYIGPGAFASCGLTSITIPKSVSDIGEVAFKSCKNLSSIIVEEGNTTFDSRDNCNAVIYTKTNVLISGCKSTVIPNTVTAIGKRAFEGYETLTEITISNSVTTIAENAFYHTCIESLHIPSSVTTIGSQAFGHCYKLKTITFEKWPENVGSKIVFYGSNALEQVIVFDREPTAIGDDTFLNSYDGTWTAATLYVPTGTKALYEATDGWKNFKNIVEVGLAPMENEDEIDYGKDGNVDENTDLEGTIIDNVYYNISPDDGGFDAKEKCIVVNNAMSDEEIESVFGKDLQSDEVKQTYTGLVIMVPAGKGNLMMNAQATGGMTLKVKIGSADPLTLEFDGKMKVTVPYNVIKPTYVYIYAGEPAAASRRRTGGANDKSLRIYGIGIDEDEIMNGDVNDDGSVDIADAVCIVNHIVGKPTSEFVYASADVNSDVTVDIADAVRIVNLVVGKINALARQRQTSLPEPE